MRIARVELRPYESDWLPPWLEAEPRRGVILGLLEESGAAGFGESAPLPGFGLETVASSEAALQLAAKYLVGLPRERYRDAIADLHRLAPVVASPSARHAIDLALHDLAAQAAGVPVARLLGGSGAVDEVAVNAVLPRLARERLAGAAAAAVGGGYDTVKIKVGGVPVAEDVTRVLAVRDRVGPTVKIRIDANRAWSEADAIAALEGLAGAGLEYCEEPVAGSEAMARVKAAAPVRIAADESVVDLASARLLLERRAADALVLKPMALGGLGPARAIAELAREFGVDVVVTSMLESPVGRRGALHLAASLGATRHAHGLGIGCLPWRADDPGASPRLRIDRDEGPGSSFRAWFEPTFVEALHEEEV